jgi:hypothetical protein
MFGAVIAQVTRYSLIHLTNYLLTHLTIYSLTHLGLSRVGTRKHVLIS